MPTKPPTSRLNRPLINRREFLQFIAALSCSQQAFALSRAPQTESGLGESVLGDGIDIYAALSDPWLTLAEVQEHLFPADDSSPGARDIGALSFLKNMLQAPDTEADEKDFILQGVKWLNDLARQRLQLNFAELDSNAREKILRIIESSDAGSRWLSLMLSYLLEALLSDPVYGGNRNEKGWAWLEHQPGFPTPNADQVYFKLKPSTRRSTKA